MQLINKKATRKFILDYSKGSRAYKYTRVSSETLETLNTKMVSLCIRVVCDAPSNGRTL